MSRVVSHRKGKGRPHVTAAHGAAAPGGKALPSPQISWEGPDREGAAQAQESWGVSGRGGPVSHTWGQVAGQNGGGHCKGEKPGRFNPLNKGVCSPGCSRQVVLDWLLAWGSHSCFLGFTHGAPPCGPTHRG